MKPISKKVLDQVWYQSSNHVWYQAMVNVWNQVCDQVWSRVRNPAKDHVWKQVEAQLKAKYETN